MNLSKGLVFMRKFTIKYIIPLLFLSLYCIPVFAAGYVPPADYNTTGPGGAPNNLSIIIMYAYYVSATFMIFMGIYQLARGFADEEFSKNKKDGLIFMIFGTVIYALAIGGGVTFTKGSHPTYFGTDDIIFRLSTGLTPIAQGVILWGIVHYIMAFIKDGLEGKHKGVSLIAIGITLGLFAEFAVEILGSIDM